MRDSMAMLDALRTRDFMPRDDGVSFDWLPSARANATDIWLVRVIMDDTDILILLMTGNEVEISRVTLRNVPLEVFQLNLGAFTDAARGSQVLTDASGNRGSL